MEGSSVALPTGLIILNIGKLLTFYGIALLCLTIQVIGGVNLVNYTVNGWSVPVCPSTGLCNNGNAKYNAECSAMAPDGRDLICKCDSVCYFYADCCIDYFLNCNTIIPPDAFQRAVEGITFKQLHCIPRNKGGGQISGNNSYIMVAKCSQDWVDRLNISSKCEDPWSVDDPLTVLHVVHLDSISFKNVYCAVCNNRDLGELRPWGFKAQCYDEGLQNVSARNYTLDQMGFAMETCWGWELKAPSFKPTAARECKSVFDTCEAGTDPLLAGACDSYTGILDMLNGSYFKNPHCFHCYHSNLYNRTLNEINRIIESIPCPEDITDSQGPIFPRPIQPPHGTFPISVLFDFRSVEVLENQLISVDDGHHLVPCNNQEVLHPFTLNCVNLTCPKGYSLTNKACIQQSSQSMYCNGSIIPTSVHIDCSMMMASDPQRCQPSSSIANKLISTFIKPLELATDTTSSEVNAFLLQNESCIQTLNVLGFIDPKTEIPFTFVDNIFVFLDTSNTFNNFSCNISTFEIILGCQDIEDTCPSGLVSLEGIKRFFDDDIGLWFKAADNKTHDLTNSLYTLRYSMDDSDYYARHEFLYVCPRITCPLVAMNASLFEHLPLGELVFLPYNLTLVYDQYFYFDHQTIYICSSLLAGGESSVSFLNFSPAQSLLTVTGLCLSIAALCFTFMTYIQFSRLRKATSNFLIISLCLSLILAQLFFLLMVPASYNPEACVSVAILGHFMWLSVFSHSTSLAVDLQRRFGVTVTIGTVDEGTRALAKFLSFAWGFPLLIVIPCIGIYFGQVDFPNFNLSYGQSVCWIGDGLANLYVFGIPIAVLILVNTVLFVMVVIGLHRVRSNVASIQEKSNESLLREELLIYIKMSTLLGFTWAFGFIAALADVTALWYVFIVLNSLQGVYIFIAFVCTKKGLRVWRDVCLCGTSTSKSTSTSRKTTSFDCKRDTRTESVSLSNIASEVKTG